MLLLTVRMHPLCGEQPVSGPARQDLIDGLRYVRRRRTLAPLVFEALIGTLDLAPALFPDVGFTVDRWRAAVFFTGCGGICLLAAALGITFLVFRRAEL
ncbi:hypothetical protein [Streptomyces sp. NPDC001930]|uniref:hypothetical protein n=1 Tax=Streptomyces sp. NPDC001930 TaxID=3364625 RepID=UPI00367CE4A3